MRVCINPIYSPTDHTEGGIRRVVEAMVKYLPEFGIETTPNADGADLIVNHGTYNMQRPGVPSVAACHGLYWRGYDWPAWGYQANRGVTESLTDADAITVPSEWVARAVTRGLWRPVHVIYHGVEAEEWAPEPQHRGYVLWNKARTDPVSDHKVVDKLAEAMPQIPFVTTFGTQRENVRATGPVPYETMKLLVRNAGVFLATPRETFGIGTLEALAAGVPIVGWRHGGQEEIVIEGETGYLAEPGDYEELQACVRRALEDRRRLSYNAAEDARRRWGWRDRVQQYAELYESVLKAYRAPQVVVSVVITSYNLGKFLNAALGSVIDQTLDQRAWECIIVDDRSTDNSLETAKQLIGYYQGRGTYNLRVVQPPRNLGLSGARNYGAMAAKGRYLLFLDADDMLAPNALVAMASFLENQREFDITYGMLDTVAEDGGQTSRNPWPDGKFDYRHQMAHLNQLPYAAMMRRRVWENLGGYRTRDWRAEDAGFWCRATSFGYHIAPATTETTLIYRIRSGSKSGQERSAHADADGDWTSWFPWRLGASSGQEGAELIARKPAVELNPSIVPFGAQGKPPYKRIMWDVRHHQDPAVSIIIPVGSNHTELLVDALDSVMAQTCPSWEVVVVFDNSQPLPERRYPWARFMYSNGGMLPPYDPLGAGAARNVGLRAARAPLALFLDADDVLRPEALERMLGQYAAEGGYVYCDVLAVPEDGRIADLAVSDWRQLPTLPLGSRVETACVVPAAEWDQALFLQRGYDNRPGCHSVTALVAVRDALGVKGFDEKMTALEDWEFYMRFAASGITGHLVREPLLLYRLSTGTLREGRRANQAELEATIKRRYLPFATGEQPMCACGSGGGGPAAQRAAAEALLGMLPPELEAYMPDPNVPSITGFTEAQNVRLMYTGDRYAAVAYRGKGTHRTYRAGNDPAYQAIDVDPTDVQGLLMTGDFRVVEVVEGI